MQIANFGTWNSNPTGYDQQWQAGPSKDGPWSDVAGAIGTTYSPPDADNGRWFRAAVWGRNVTGRALVPLYSSPLQFTANVSTVITLPALTLTPAASSFQIGTPAAAAGATLATFSGAHPSATLSVPPGETRYVLNPAKTAVLVGASPLAAADPLTISVIQTLAGASNSPRPTSVSITVTNAATTTPATPADALDQLQGARLVFGGSKLLNAFSGTPVTASGGTVSAVADQTGVVQAIGLGSNPTPPTYLKPGDAGFQSSYFNGLPYLSFNGFNQHLESDLIYSGTGAILVVAAIRRRAAQPNDFGCPFTVMGGTNNYNGGYPFLRPYFRPNGGGATGGIYLGNNEFETTDLTAPTEAPFIIAFRRNADGTAQLRVNDAKTQILTGTANPFPARLLMGSSLPPGSPDGAFLFTGAFDMAFAWVTDAMGDEDFLCAEFARRIGLKPQSAVDTAWAARASAGVTGTTEPANPVVVTPPPVIGGTPVAGGTTPATPIARVADSSYPSTTFTSIPLTLTGTGAPAGSVYTQIQGFQRGHLFPGDPLVWKTSGGTACETQYDAAPSTFWADGSIMATAIHIALPSLGNGATEAGALFKQASPSGTAINLATALSGKSVTVNVGGFSYDVIANLPAARWHQGNLKASTRCIANIPRAAMGGGTDGRLIVDIGIDKQGVMTVEVTPRNDFALKANQGRGTYDLRVYLGGNERLTRTGIVAPLYTAYTNELRVASDGTTLLPTRVAYAKLDAPYWQRTGILLHYDQQFSVAQSVLDECSAVLNDANFNTPYSYRGLQPITGGPGDAPNIGFADRIASTAYLTSNPIAIRAAIAQSEAALSAPLACWDETHGRWLNSVDRPYAWFDRGHRDMDLGSNDYGWDVDGAHMGDYFLAAYLYTGRRSFCDGINLQASFGIMLKWPEGQRGMPANTEDSLNGRNSRMQEMAATSHGASLRWNDQMRACGWVTRQCLDAHALVPTTEQPHGNYHYALLKGNFQQRIDDQLSAQANMEMWGLPTHWIYGTEGGNLGPPWQTVFILSQDIRAARMEIPGALDHVTWADHFWSGSFQRGDFDWSDMMQYNWQYVTGGVPGYPSQSGKWLTYAAVKAALGGVAFGPNFRDNGMGLDYPQRQVVVTSQLYDLFADHGKSTSSVADAYAKLQSMPPDRTATDLAAFARDPRNCVTRRGQTRA
ncbi:hypothetical protein EAH89_26235 [Roseomonas nepalensis]|uniref:Uncharacterized protein n=1 Tax=Muricoccus nepalensis TaxID=1854500 RepID=A0A502F8I1_9PROT|nr:hypothetical protein [Roseomonas nepalensis]TPG45702.1 hypothetical protein EAH89_26235 [Roseomonas nepalensis]